MSRRASSFGGGGAADLFQLEPKVLGRELQLPHAPAAFRSPPERDPRLGEGVVSGVVVDRREDPGLERLAAQVGQLEALGGLQLALVLGECLHEATIKHAVARARLGPDRYQRS